MSVCVCVFVSVSVCAGVCVKVCMCVCVWIQEFGQWAFRPERQKSDFVQSHQAFCSKVYNPTLSCVSHNCLICHSPWAQLDLGPLCLPCVFV